MEHTLADEMDGWSIDPVRACHFVELVTEQLDHVHPALVPANIVIDDNDRVRLVEVAPPRRRPAIRRVPRWAAS